MDPGSSDLHARAVRHAAMGSSEENLSAPKVCSSCRRPLTRHGPNGECLRCLFGIALLPENDAGASVAELSNSESEARRYGHFEVALTADGERQELGHGAMGRTYRAQDTVLNSVVALKVIDRNFAGHPDTRARFLREARAAARLRHPNVASVFHYGEQESECFYVMELVEGETLEARVRRDGPLPAALALEVAVQVARALVAAEAQGIVHRDLKPANLMLVAGNDDAEAGKTPLVKVIDFGLAKAAAAGGNIPGLGDTRGGFVGTPAFASPEQFARTEDERIDTRSDIYSLGVTLWYLLCGKLPFVGQTLTEIYEQQIRQPLPLEHLKAARVPAPIVGLLHSMLAVAPAARPQSARELLKFLSDCQMRLSASSPARRRLRFLGWAGVLGVLVIASLIWMTRQQGVSPAGGLLEASVAVLPFENLSPEASDAFFTQGVRDALASDLGFISRLKVVGAASVKSYPPGKPRDLPAIGQVLGAAYLLEGNVRREGGRMRVELKLADLRDPARNWVGQYDRPLTEEFALLSEITHTVAGHLGAPPSPAEAAVINRRPTHDPVAYDLYLRSRERPGVHMTDTDLRRATSESVALLDQAIARDPGFVLAHCRLVSEHDSIATHLLGATAEELAVDHRALAEAALAQAQRLQPDSGDVHLAAATHHLTVTRDYERARTEAELARRTLPNNFVIETLTGRIARKQGRWDDSVRALERAVALDPRNVSGHAFLEQTYVAVRNYDGADREFVTMQSLLPPGAVVTLSLARATLVLESQADTAPLRAALAEVTDADDPEHQIREVYGLILALFDHNESRVRYVLAGSKEEDFSWAGFKYPRAWFEALAARMRKDEAAARTAFTAARDAVEKTVQANPRDERNLLLLAMIDAGLGRREDAVRQALEACAMPPLESEMPVEPSNRCCLAVVYAWTSQPELAFAELDKLVSGIAGAHTPNQVTYGDFRLNPLWDPLRADPRFDALVQRLAPLEHGRAAATPR